MRNKVNLALFCLGGFTLVAVVVFLASVNVAAAAIPFEVIASGLNNPRGLTFDSDGTLYVAEAGTGGPSTGDCAPAGKGTEVCFGATGAVTRILADGTQDRIVSDLPSLANPDPAPPAAPGDEATGPHDVAVTASGELYVTIGLGGDLATREQFGTGGDNLGRLIEITADDTWEAVADLTGYEEVNNPDGNQIDSNPYGLLAVGDELVAVDAGGNSLLHISESYTITTIADFPTRTVEFPPGSGNMQPMDAVPTTVIGAGTDMYYVGQLTGFPFPPGGANIYHVMEGSEPAVHEGGFTNIIDIAEDGSGGMYVVEIAMNGLLSGPPGALVHLADDGTRTVVVSDTLIFPGGVAIGPDDAIYLTNLSISAGGGQVVRIPTTPTSVAVTDVSGGPVAAAPLVALAMVLAAVPMAAFVIWWRRGAARR